MHIYSYRKKKHWLKCIWLLRHFSPASVTMVRSAPVTVRRGTDFVCIHDAAMAREFLGLPPAAASSRARAKSKGDEKKIGKGTQKVPDAEVLGAGADRPLGKSRKARRRRRRAQMKSEQAMLEDLNDKWADDAPVLGPRRAVLPATVPGIGGLLLAAPSSSSTSNTPAFARILRAQRSTTRSPPPRRDRLLSG